MNNISKKFIAIFTLIALFISIFPSSTNSAPVWTRENADHLARRALFGVTPEIVDTLYNAGSATNAVNILFSSETGPDRTNFDSLLNSYASSSGFSITSQDSMRKYYQMKYYYDPYEAKAKLFTVFEDTLASAPDSGRKINYADIENTHKLIYKYIFGSYKDLIKKIIFTNGQELGDFTEGAYLDLYNQTNKNYPNENFARELIQLFLLSEYKPNESKDLGNTRNYEESDVASLAKILFGFKTDSNNIVSYAAPGYSGASVTFLTGSLKVGDESKFSSFYNSSSGTINLDSIQQGGGLTLRDNIIDYIFSKRENEIALFMANKFFRAYVHENPTTSDLQTLADVYKNNDFKSYETVKWLLASDMMYTETAKNELRYKNPLELAIGTLKVLNQNDKNYSDPEVVRSSLLSNLNWNPYAQDSIFGRDGYDKNENFYNANIHNKWISYVSYLAYSSANRTTSFYNLLPYTSTGVTTYNNFSEIDPLLLNSKTLLGTGTITYLSGSTSKNYTFTSASFDAITQKLKTNLGDLTIDFSGMTVDSNISVSFLSGTLTTTGSIFPITSATFSPKTPGLIERSLTPEEIISYIEEKILLGKTIDSNTKTQLISFLNTDEKGNSIIFDSTRDKEKIESLISIILTLPEFVLNSGFSIASEGVNESSFLNSINSKIVFVNLGGGYDYLYNFFPKKNEEAFKTLRPTLYRKTNEIVPVDPNYYMSNSIAYGSGGTNGFKSVFDSDNLRIFNRVGAVAHTRDHDQAGRSMQSIDSNSITNVDGFFGRLIKNDIPTNTMVVGSNSKPFALKNGKYVNIGAGGNILTSYKFSNGDKKNQVLNVIRNIGNSKIYPSNTSGVFKDAVTIDSIGTVAKNNIGRDGAGWGNSQNYDFIKTMLGNNYGKAFYMYGDGGYDTHAGEGTSLDPNINKVVTSMVKFFDEVKSTQDITIVLFSEFGRTIKENSGTDGAGTDHGKAGVMYVLTNNSNLKTLLPQKIYGDLDVTKEKEDLLGVGIYYDSIYDKIFNALYNRSGMFQHNLQDELSTAIPVITNLNTELKPYYSNYNATISFDIESPNFAVKSAGNVILKYGNNFNSLSQTNNWETWQSSNPLVKLNNVKFTRSTSGTGYVYDITVSNNQYITKNFTGSIDLNLFKTGSYVISDNKDTILSSITNKIISGEENLINKILLGQTTGTGTTEKILTKGNGISLILGSGSTYIDRLSGSGVWNGRFILGDLLDKNYIFSSGAITGSGEKLREMNVSKLLKIGADTIGVGMKLDRDIEIEVSGLTASSKFKIISSEDLLNWQNHITGIYSDATGKLRFSTNHFTYFAVVPDEPDDITPDGFNFSPLTSKELSTSYESNTIIVSGINKAVNISITGSGEYSVNGGAYTSSAGTVVSGDIIKVRLISSSSYNTTLSTTLNISGVISSFSVATKIDSTIITPPVIPSTRSSSNGSGGGLIRDYCPSGDYSASYYDKTCGNNINIDTSSTGTTSGTGKKLEYTIIKNNKKNVPSKKKQMIQNSMNNNTSTFTSTSSITLSSKDIESYINFIRKNKGKFQDPHKQYLYMNQLKLQVKIIAKRKGLSKEKIDEIMNLFESNF